ncbi:MAG: hypothetical protein ACM3XM_06610 [Mycobacterium leprae]
MKRWGWLLLVIVTTLLLAATVAHAASGDLLAPLVPGHAERLSERYPVWNYIVDGDFSYQDMAGRLIGTALNFLLLARAWLVYAALRSVEYALRFELLRPIATAVTAIHDALAATFWQADGSPWVTAALVTAGGLGLLATLSGRVRGAYRVAFGTGATLLLALSLMAVTPRLLLDAQETVRSTAGGALAPIVALLPRTEAEPDQRLLAGAGEELWRTSVFDPWVFLEFGGPQQAANHAGDDGLPGTKVLALLPSQRQNYFQQVPYQRKGTDFAWWTADYTARRLMLAVLLLGTAFLSAGAVLLLSAEILLQQLFLGFWLALLPVWALSALWWPGGGLRLLRRWLLRGLQSLVLQIIFTLLLGVLLVLAYGLARALSSAGWLLTSLMQALLGVVAWRYRREWLNLPRHWDLLPLPVAAWGERSQAIERLPSSQTARRVPAATCDAQAALVPIVGARPVEPPVPESEPDSLVPTDQSLDQVHREFWTLRQELLFRSLPAEEVPQQGFTPSRQPGESLPAATPPVASDPVSHGRRRSRQTLDSVPVRRPHS